jgi:hypothetical protein
MATGLTSSLLYAIRGELPCGFHHTYHCFDNNDSDNTSIRQARVHVQALDRGISSVLGQDANTGTRCPPPGSSQQPVRMPYCLPYQLQGLWLVSSPYMTNCGVPGIPLWGYIKKESMASFGENTSWVFTSKTDIDTCLNHNQSLGIHSLSWPACTRTTSI